VVDIFNLIRWLAAAMRRLAANNLATIGDAIQTGEFCRLTVRRIGHDGQGCTLGLPGGNHTSLMSSLV